MVADQLGADDFENVKEALVVQLSIYVLPAIFQAVISDFVSQ